MTTPPSAQTFASLRIQAPSATVTAGAPITLGVAALDANGAVVTNYSGTLYLSSSDPNALLPASYTMQAADQGQHNFTVALVTSGAQSFTVADNHAAITSRINLTVNPGAPARLAFADYPRRINLQAIGSVTVIATDTYGNTTPGFSGTVSFSSSDTGVTVPVPYAFQSSDAGSHTFMNSVSFATSGVQTLSVQAPSFSTVTERVLVATLLPVAEHDTWNRCQLHAGSVKCWGLNGYGNLGLGDTRDRGWEPNQMGTNLPTVDLGGSLVSVIATGERHTCALLTTGVVKCWGDNTDGKLGDDLNNNFDFGSGSAYPMGASLPAVDLALPVINISTGYWHTCVVLSDYSLRCWGWDMFGQLGQGNTIEIGTGPGQISSKDNTPAPVNVGGRVIALSSGYAHTCALLDTYQVKCWGDNVQGQLGVGDTVNRGDQAGTMGTALPAVNLGTGRYAVSLAAQGYGTCALLDDASVKCWGQNDVGELGLGDTIDRGVSAATLGDNLPAIDFGGHTVKSITSGYFHSCAILDDGSTRCWGSNSQGELGLGDTTPRGSTAGQMGNNLPAVSLGTNRTAQALSLGNSSSCAYLDNNQTKCWGWDPNGQLGYGDTKDRGNTSNQMGDSLPYVPLF